jgi:hypothetical protein
MASNVGATVFGFIGGVIFTSTVLGAYILGGRNAGAVFSVSAGSAQRIEPSASPVAATPPSSDNCAAPARLLALLPPKVDIVAALETFDSKTEPWPPTFLCEPMGAFGGAPGQGGDGQKQVCGLPQMKAPCAIYSLGSNLDFSFEESVSSATPCEIVTIDCTVNETKAQAMLPPRTTFFPLCIGPASMGKAYVSLPALMQLAGHDHVDLLKLDIEGYETFVIKSLLDQPRHAKLPYQINIETHGGKSAGAVHRALLVLGYVPVNKEQNKIWHPGWEWTWVRAFCDLSDHVSLSEQHPRQKYFHVGEVLDRGDFDSWPTS